MTRRKPASKGVARYRERVAERERLLNALVRAHGLFHFAGGSIVFAYVVALALLRSAGVGSLPLVGLALVGLVACLWAFHATRRAGIRRANRLLLGDDAEPSPSLAALRERLGVRVGDDMIDYSKFGLRGLEARTALFTILLPVCAVAVAIAVVVL